MGESAMQEVADGGTPASCVGRVGHLAPAQRVIGHQQPAGPQPGGA